MIPPGKTHSVRLCELQGARDSQPEIPASTRIARRTAWYLPPVIALACVLPGTTQVSANRSAGGRWGPDTAYREPMPRGVS